MKGMKGGSVTARISGAFLGLACGDALGATLEFMSRDEIRRRYPGGHRDLTGGGPFRWKPGETTDDTAMALAVARGILAAGPDAPVDRLVEEVGREFVRWAASGPKDIGGTVDLAITAFRRFGDWAQASAHVRRVLGDHAAGNGALMRTLPVSFFWPDDPERTVAVSRALTRMTHPHLEAEWCSAFYNLYVQALLRGSGKALGWEWAVATLAEVAPDLRDVAEALGQRMASAGRLAEYQVRPTGYCVDTLEAALWAFWALTSAEDCIVLAANLGGDADTVAAVAGGLAGAYYGADALPARWLERLMVRQEIEEILEAIPVRR